METRPKSQSKTFSPCLPSDRLPEGKLQFGDSESARENQLEKIPSWFNLELARKGQRFARERLYGVFYSHLIAAFFLLALKDTRKILYYTQKSHTAEKAFRRYLATLLQVKLWYDSELSDDLSSPFFASLNNVRKIHRAMGERVQREHPDFSVPLVQKPEDMEEEESDKTIRERGKLWEAFKADLDSSEIAQHIIPGKENPAGSYYFSQFDMALTQWSFVALPIMYTQQLGLHDVSDGELEGFIHLWAIITHTLGIEPKYNICLVPDLKSFRVHAEWIYENQYLQGFFDLGCEGEVMWSALAEAACKIFPSLNAENLLLEVLEDYIGVPCPKLRQQTRWATSFRRFCQQRLVRPLLYCRWFQQYCNNYVRGIVAKLAANFMGLDSRNGEEISKRAFY